LIAWARLGNLARMTYTPELSRQTLASSEIAGLTMEGYYNRLDALYARLEEMQRKGNQHSRKDFLSVIHQIRDLRQQNPYRKTET